MTKGERTGELLCPKCLAQEQMNDKEFQQKKMQESVKERTDEKRFSTVEEQDLLDKIYAEKGATTVGEKTIVMRYEVGEDVCISAVDKLLGLEYTYVFYKLEL